MKRESRTKPNDIRSEYDFASMRGGVRGKYVKQYRAGSNLVLLEDDVARVFRTDGAVNEALRTVIRAAEAIPHTKRPSKRRLTTPRNRRRT